MKYSYQAKTKDGELQVGIVEAGSRDSAVNILSSHDLFILSITEAEKERWYQRIGGIFGGAKRKDIVIFTRQLSILLEARLPLNSALKTLAEQTSNQHLKEAIFVMSEDIDSGLSFSQALERQSEIFSPFFVSMVRAAEVTGNLDEIANYLADYFEKDMVLVQKARGAMIYPGIVLSLFFGVIIIMVTVVFPQLGPVFEESGVELPFFTRAMLATGTFLVAWWPAAIVAVFFAIGAGISYLRTPEGRALWDEFKFRAPILKKVFVPVSIARFSNASAILIKGGVPISQAMEIVSHTVDNVILEEAIHEASESVREGIPLSQSIAAHPDFFPPLVSQMLVVGETTGQIDQIFARLSSFYNREADQVINNIVDLIQPILMVGIGVLTGFLFASIIMPLYDLTSKF